MGQFKTIRLRRQSISTALRRVLFGLSPSFTDYVYSAGERNREKEANRRMTSCKKLRCPSPGEAGRNEEPQKSKQKVGKQERKTNGRRGNRKKKIKRYGYAV